MSHLYDALSQTTHHRLWAHLLFFLSHQLVERASQLPYLPHPCSQVPQPRFSTPGKTRQDEQVAALVEHYRRSRKRGEAKKENSYVECKAERLLLIDVITDDLLLPYNRIAATF